MKKYLPTANRLIIERKLADDVTEGGIVVPTTAKETPRDATVLDIGPDVVGFEPGDTVLTALYKGTDLPSEDERRIQIILDKDVICKVVEA